MKKKDCIYYLLVLGLMEVYKKFIQRAFGRSSPYYNTRSHIEIAIVEE
ncbi:MAG: hypothetical protein ACTSU9_16180 [Promethearchaeota archaeon]